MNEVSPQTLCEALGGAVQKAGKWHCLCPAHDDQKPSLCIEDRDDRLVWTCRAGCDQAAVTAAVLPILRRCNGNGTGKAPKADKTPPPWERPVDRVHDYPSGQKVRFSDGLEPKFLKRRGPDDWKAPGVAFPIYREAEALEAVSRGEMILLCEGERDADTAAAHGFAATSGPDGPKWRPEHSEALRGARVVVVPDADGPGWKQGHAKAEALEGIAASVHWLELPGLDASKGRKDVTDWFHNGGTAEQLERLMAEAPDWTRHDAKQALDRFYDTQNAIDGPQESRRGFRLYRADSFDPKPPAWLIRDLLEADSLAEVFGDPGCGKSFLALDWACCIATGREYQGRQVQPGPVVYLAGEGRNGIARRLRAWCIARGESIADVPLYLSNGPASLCEQDSANQVRDAVAQVAQQDGAPVLVVVDTLARNFGPGDENATREMNAVIAALDMIRAEHGATVLVVHHTGHADKARARGAMALKGALDAEYRMERGEDDVIRVQASKMKDAPEPDPTAYRLRSVELDMVDDEGQPVTSAVLDPVDYVELPKRGKAARGANQQKALKAYSDVYNAERRRLDKQGREDQEPQVSEAAWRAECEKHGIDRRRWPEVLKSLTDQGKIDVQDGYVSVVSDY